MDKTQELQDFLRYFNAARAQLGLKYSVQREWIISVLFTSEKHLSVRDIVSLLREQRGARVSEATVYRNLKSLLDLGLVQVVQDAQEKRYEIKPEKHHDHLICTQCGEIFEFFNADIEHIQESLARDIGFVVTDHVMTLYGVCSKCQKKG